MKDNNVINNDNVAIINVPLTLCFKFLIFLQSLEIYVFFIENQGTISYNVML